MGPWLLTQNIMMLLNEMAKKRKKNLRNEGWNKGRKKFELKSYFFTYFLVRLRAFKWKLQSD